MLTNLKQNFFYKTTKIAQLRKNILKCYANNSILFKKKKTQKKCKKPTKL